jgi:mRNA interferase MazF
MVLVLTRDPVADRIGSVVVVALTRTRRGLVSELVLTTGEDRVTQLSARRMTHVCRTLRDALGC